MTLLVAAFNTTFNLLFGRWVPAQAVQRLSGSVGEYLLFTLAAQVMILPVQAYHFQRLSLVGLLLLNGVVWQGVLAKPDGRLHVTVLSVGSADALLVQTPDGRRLLNDGGPSTTRLADALGRRLPLLDRHLDAWIVALPSQENLTALPDLVERYPPSQVLWAGETSGTVAGRRLVRELARLNIPLVSLESGQTLDLGEGVRLHVLAAGRRGAALLLQWQRFRLLLPLGVDFESLPLLLEDPELKDVTALLLAEGGFAPANPPELIAHLSPRLALISVAAGDWQGLPSRETLEALDGRTVLRTDQVGWIHLSTDGEELWVEVERR